MAGSPPIADTVTQAALPLQPISYRDLGVFCSEHYFESCSLNLCFVLGFSLVPNRHSSDLIPTTLVLSAPPLGVPLPAAILVICCEHYFESCSLSLCFVLGFSLVRPLTSHPIETRAVRYTNNLYQCFDGIFPTMRPNSPQITNSCCIAAVVRVPFSS